MSSPCLGRYATQLCRRALLIGMTIAFELCCPTICMGAVTTFTGVYAGGTIAPNDTVVLNNGATVAGNVVTNGTLQFNQSGTNLTVSSTVSGTGTLSLTNTGTLTLTATGTNAETVLTTQTVLSAGRLQIGASGTGRLLVGGTLSLQGGSLTSSDSRLFFPGDWIVAGWNPPPPPTSQAYVTSGTWLNTGNMTVGNASGRSGAVTISDRGSLLVGGTLSFSMATGSVSLMPGGTLQIGLGGTSGVLDTASFTTHGTLAFNRSDSIEYAGAISGSGGVVQMGYGALTLSGNNTYSGTTQVASGLLAISGNSASPVRASGGTLQLLSPNALFGGNTSQWLPANVTVDSGATLLLDTSTFTTSNIAHLASLGTGSNGLRDGARIGLNVSSGSFSYSNSLANVNGGLNRIGLTKTGAGTLILLGSNSYTGGTYITSGALQIGNGNTGGSITGDIQNDGILNLNRIGAVISLAGSISGGGSLVVQDGTVVLSGTNSYTGRTDVRTGSGGALLHCMARQTLYGGDSSKWTAGNITVAPYAGLRLSVGGANEFTAADIDVIRTIGTGSSGFMDGSYLSFDTTNATSGTFVYAGSIGNTNGARNSVGINKTGAGTLVLLGSNSYTGGTYVASGALQIGNGGTSGSIIGGLAGSAVIFNRSDASTFPGNATLAVGYGTAAFTKLGQGTLTLTGTINAEGDFRVAEGAVQVSPSASVTLPTARTGIMVYVGGSAGTTGALTVNGGLLSSYMNFVGYEEGSFGVVNMLSGTMNADGYIPNRDLASWGIYRGAMNVSGGFVKGVFSVRSDGVLNVSGGLVNGSATINGTGTLSGGEWSGGSLNVGSQGLGVFTVSGGVFNVDSAVLGNSAAGNGSVTISGGTMSISSFTAGSLGVGRLTMTGGSLSTSRATLGQNSSSLGACTISGGSWFNAGDLLVGGSGSGSLIVTGSGGVGGALIVGGTLSTGGLGLLGINAQGTLQIGAGGNSGALAVAAFTNHGTLVFQRSGASAYSGSISGSGAVIKNADGVITLSGNSAYTGGTTLNAGSLVAGHANAFGLGAIVINSGTLNLASLAIANQITNNGGSIINAVNYAGTQAVSGVVSMTGTIGGAVNVAASGELRGSGAVFTGPVSLASGALHSPGNSPGSQTFTAGLSYSAGSRLNWELIANTASGAGASYDFLSVTGGPFAVESGALLNLVFSGSGSAVNWSDPFWNANRSWTIIDALLAVSSTGEFTLGTVSNDSLGQSLLSVRPDAAFALDHSGNNVVLTFTAVPEPSTYVLALLGLGVTGWSMHRRKMQRARKAA